MNGFYRSDKWAGGSRGVKYGRRRRCVPRAPVAFATVAERNKTKKRKEAPPLKALFNACVVVVVGLIYLVLAPLRRRRCGPMRQVPERDPSLARPTSFSGLRQTGRGPGERAVARRRVMIATGKRRKREFRDPLFFSPCYCAFVSTTPPVVAPRFSPTTAALKPR